MNIFERVMKKILKFLGLLKLSENPNSDRLTYINDEEEIRLANIRTNKFWYIGDGDELLNWYTNKVTYGFAKNPIYNRNKRQYFWSRSVPEDLKRIHSGIPKAIVDTMSGIVGMPHVTSKVAGDVLGEIFKENNFDFMLTQQSRPMTLVEGDGAWKININKKLSNHPLIEYYGAEDWAPIYKSNILIGMCFFSYYQDADNKYYILYETRSLREEGMAIEYELYRLEKGNYITSVPLDTLPELAELENKLFTGIKSLLAVPNRYYFDPLHKNRGKSIYDGKLDLFDFLDEILTQAGQTNRVSTPVEYFPVDLLERGRNGLPIVPATYNRQYVKVEGTIDGDGNVNNTIQTTQPELNYDKYMQLFKDTLCNGLIGLCSPASLGFDVARDDNAMAQREKEKQTIFTRGLIINNETKALVSLCNQLLIAQNYMDTGVPQDQDFQISIKYDEFANPSFESELQVLGPAWVAGEISTERYATLLWAGKLSDEELAEEIAWLDEQKAKDDFSLEGLTDHENELRDRSDLSTEGQGKEKLKETEEQVPSENL